MNDPTNVSLSLSKYSHHFYQNPESFPESQQNIDYADEIDYMEIEQGWFQSYSVAFWTNIFGYGILSEEKTFEPTRKENLIYVSNVAVL